MDAEVKLFTLNKSDSSGVRVIRAAAQQFNGREGETATFLSRFSVNSELRGFGFAPRHLNRWAFLGKPRLRYWKLDFFKLGEF